MYSQTMVSNENDTPATRRSTKKADVTCCTHYSYNTGLANIGMLFILATVFLFHSVHFCYEMEIKKTFSISFKKQLGKEYSC